MIGGFLFRTLFGEKVRSLWYAGMCTILWDFWCEINNGVFKGLERGPLDDWSLIKFQVSL